LHPAEDVDVERVVGVAACDRRVSRTTTFSAMSCRWVTGALLCVALLVPAACSGDDTAGPPAETVVAAPAPTSPPTTLPIVPTTADSTTTTTMSTTSTTTSTPTTTTTTTVAAPSLHDLEAEVAAAYDEIYEGYWACLRAPLQCDTSWLVEGSGSAEAMQNTMQALADRARYVGDDPVGYYVIESIEFDETRTEATVTSCWWSTAVLYTTPVDPNRPPGPDNPPTVVADRPSSGYQVDRLGLTDNGWSLRMAELLGDDSAENVCGEGP
jgi:hypothetical protein